MHIHQMMGMGRGERAIGEGEQSRRLSRVSLTSLSPQLFLNVFNRLKYFFLKYIIVCTPMLLFYILFYLAKIKKLVKL